MDLKGMDLPCYLRDQQKMKNMSNCQRDISLVLQNDPSIVNITPGNRFHNFVTQQNWEGKRKWPRQHEASQHFSYQNATEVGIELDFSQRLRQQKLCEATCWRRIFIWDWCLSQFCCICHKTARTATWTLSERPFTWYDFRIRTFVQAWQNLS